jgi:UDP-glucose 6-dehydrogenase
MIGQVMYKSGMGEEIDNVLDAIGSDSRVGHKYLGYGFGFGGPCLPRDNRAFAACAKKLGLEYNLGHVTDSFNEEHSKFLLDYYVNNNPMGLPYAIGSIAYKRETDILTESQQYKLCLGLLDLGYKVYVVDNIVEHQCDSRINWGSPKEEVIWIDL